MFSLFSSKTAVSGSDHRRGEEAGGRGGVWTLTREEQGECQLRRSRRETAAQDRLELQREREGRW